ncbi:hypothetical protein [Paenibacillus faecalis]|uniref:hypothetical protein n=1 Tax=Paenibacillus faecalis TaxID=2079532 RepID=UPI000D10B5F0|nr:hypothetical protein [Paenibacillus faecalis]
MIYIGKTLITGSVLASLVLGGTSSQNDSLGVSTDNNFSNTNKTTNQTMSDKSKKAEDRKDQKVEGFVEPDEKAVNTTMMEENDNEGIEEEAAAKKAAGKDISEVDLMQQLIDNMISTQKT